MSHPDTPPVVDESGDEAIAHAGYKPQFARTLGRFELFAVAFSFISITTGLFSTFGFVLLTGGPGRHLDLADRDRRYVAGGFWFMACWPAASRCRATATSGPAGWPHRWWVGGSDGSPMRSCP